MSQAFKHTPQATQALTSKTNVADPALWKNYEYLPIFAQMRQEDPVHYCAESP